MNNVRKLTITALLTAFAIIIPLYFGFLRIVLVPSFTATLASHVPMFISMMISPGAAIMVGVGSAIGFLITTSPVIAARASMHIFVGASGAVLIKRGMSFPKVAAITAPIHGLLEALVIIPILNTTIQSPVVGIGSVIHHFVDAAIAYVIIKALFRTTNFNFDKRKNAA